MIDWDRILELQAEIGEDGFAEIGEVFIEELTERLDAMAAAGGSSDVDDWHFLKGGALNMGLTAFAEACRQAEEAARSQGHFTQIAPVKAVFAATLEELDGVFSAG